MAVVLSAYDLIVRVEAAGAEARAFAARAPNQTFCTDGRIARVSFMTEADRNHFLATAGLPPGTFARTDKRTMSADADWIEVGRHAGVVAAWLRGAPRDPLVVPATWTPAEIEFGTWEEMKEHLEFLGVENNVEVYLDKRTGKKVYTGRTRPSLPDAELARLESVRREGGDIVLSLHQKKGLGFFERRRLKKGMAMLDAVLAALPDHWPACWLLGVGHRALAAHEQALELFRRAYAIHPENPDVGREYAAQCFMCGATKEGVRISREVHARFPDDVGLQSNLGLALLIGGDLAEAEAVATAAQQRDPSDPITTNLVNYIRDVRAGKKPRPARMPGM